MDSVNTFTIYDFIVLFSTIALSVGIGIFFACRSVSSVDHYFLANRRLSVLPTTLSLVVTYQSSLMIIGVPAESYTYGLLFGYRVLGFLISYIFAVFFVIPVFHPLKLTSVYKYFEMRYKVKFVRYLALSMGTFYLITYMGIVTFGTCVALDVLVGIPYWGTIVIYTINTAVYTSIGGMKAVIWTDVLQMTIMTIGVLAVIIKSVLHVGGFDNLYSVVLERFNMADFRVDPTLRYTFWNVVFAPFATNLMDCYSQPSIQRIRSLPSVRSAQATFVMASVLKSILSFTVCFEGIALFGYYAYSECDPITSGRIAKSNELVPLAISDLFSRIPGLQGLFVAALSSAALSTLSSCLSSLGAITYDDIIREMYPHLPQKKATNISKVFVFLYGIVAMCFSFFMSVLPGSLLKVFYALTACIDGPLCALFILSTCSRFVTSVGVTVGTISGVLVTLIFNIGQRLFVTLESEKLPPAPVNGCMANFGYSGKTSDAFANSSLILSGSHTESTIFTYENIYQGNITTPIVELENNHSVFESVFSISFMYFSLIGLLVSIIVSLLVSLCTKSTCRVDDSCVYSFRRHMFNQQKTELTSQEVTSKDDENPVEESVLLENKNTKS